MIICPTKTPLSRTVWIAAGLGFARTSTTTKHFWNRTRSLWHDLLRLFQHLLNDLLDNLALSVTSISFLDSFRRVGQSTIKSLLLKLLLDTLAPRKPLGEYTSAFLDDGLVGTGDTLGILDLEGLGVFAEVLANQLLLVLGEESGWAGAPRPLLELLDGVFT